MRKPAYNLLVILGPTASGKTRLGVRMAQALAGEIISADSRQVYRELVIGAGKDLAEYSAAGHTVPYHLIDVADLSEEFNLYRFQSMFFQTFTELQQRQTLPILVGGTGLYLEAVIKHYPLVAVPVNSELRALLALHSDLELQERLRQVQGELHNTTDFATRERIIRAIEIAEYSHLHPAPPLPEVRPLILGIAWPRPLLRERIAQRLRERLEHGLVEEVEKISGGQVGWDRLKRLGLEYRFVSEYILGEIVGREALFEKLFLAICAFAKRQETWFRRMERQGLPIHWIEQGDWTKAWEVVKPYFVREI